MKKRRNGRLVVNSARAKPLAMRLAGEQSIAEATLVAGSIDAFVLRDGRVAMEPNCEHRRSNRGYTLAIVDKQTL